MASSLETRKTRTLDPIQMLWVRGPLSRMEVLSVRSYLAQGHPVHLYTYDPPPNVPEQASIRDGSEILPANLAPATGSAPFASGSYAVFADLFRYRLLYERGGWWSDLDVVALRPWSDFPDTIVAGTNEAGYGRIANNFVMRFPAGHEAMRRCAEQCERMDIRTAGFGTTGPLLLHDVLKSMAALDIVAEPDVFSPIPWNAGWQFTRSLWERLSLDELKQRIRRPHLSCRFTHRTVAAHLWNETWRANGRDKNAIYPRTCLFEQWQRKYSPA